MEEKKPLISVVIPGWNEEKTIARTLSSLSHQKTSFPFEVIFVDNNCTDNTVKIAESFRGAIENLEIICEKKQGIGAARNAGFKAAQSEIIASTDSDTILPEDWLAKIYNTFQENPQAIGLVGTYIFEGKSRLFNLGTKIIMISADLFHRIIAGSFAFRGLNFAIKKEAWEKAGGFNPKISALEDVDLSLRAKKLGKIIYLPKLEIKTTYRRFEGRFFQQLKKRMRVYFYRVILRNTKKYTEWEQIR
ncbi:MAG: glycosyltransferase [Patescibacteria group bacterium]